MIEHFSTNQVAPDTRLDYWNELLGKTYNGLVIDPANHQFHAKMSKWTLGDLTMVWPKSAAATVARRANATAATSETVILHLIQSGNCIFEQRGRSVSLKAGDMIVCAGEEFYRFDIPSEHQVLIVEMPKAAISDRCPNLDDRLATLISGEHAPTRLLRNYMLSLWHEGAANFDDAVAHAYSDILKEMFVKSLEIGTVFGGDGGNFLSDRMKGIVAARLSDCELTPSTLANELGVSLRTLQNALSEIGTTPIAYIADRRIENAARILVMDRDKNITTVAYECGFSDSAYFSRRFHSHFGISPSQYRVRH